MTAALDMDVDLAACCRTLRAMIPGRWSLPEHFGPAGFRLVFTDDPDGQGRPAGSVIVTQSDFADGEADWLHASIARTNRDPSYADLVALKAAVFGPGREAYQVFAVESRHVNIHEHALHLWGRADGARVLPDFGALGTI